MFFAAAMLLGESRKNLVVASVKYIGLLCYPAQKIKLRFIFWHSTNRGSFLL
jgi:hypothetical protein